MSIWLPMASLVAVTAGIWDAWSGKVPNALTYSAIALGLLVRLFLEEVTDGLIGAVLALGLWGLVFLGGGLGGGDVKLFAALGAIGGTAFVIAVSLYAVVLGALFGLVQAIRTGRLRTVLVNAGHILLSAVLLRKPQEALRVERGDPIPFAVAVAFATCFRALEDRLGWNFVPGDWLAS